MKRLEELDALCSSASKVIIDLQEFIEDDCPIEDTITNADNWRSWYAGEGTDEERQAICKDLTGYNFKPLENKITIDKELWDEIIHNMENLHDITENCMVNYSSNNRIGEVNDMWKKLEDLGLYGKN